MIVETREQFDQFLQDVAQEDSFWVPTYVDPYRHYMDTSISFIYVYCFSTSNYYILPFQHSDCINLNKELLHEVKTKGNIFILGKKRFLQTLSIQCYDADLFHWWHTHKMLELNATNTSAHDFWNKWWHNETNTHAWLPIVCHIERCEAMRREFEQAPGQLTPEFERYEHLAIDNFGLIERNGIFVDRAEFTSRFHEIPNLINKVYTEYNLYTSTGRPSNKFGGVNYAALNKEDGSRKSFISGNDRGMLVEMDYDSFHPRLVADIIGYEFPDTESVHTYLGRFYFGKDDLSEEEYNQSKSITFRLLYGGIDKDFEVIPFFAKTKTYINDTWKTFNTKGYVCTPLMGRPMIKEHLVDMNPNKLFNYILQASETEYNLYMLDELNEMLTGARTKIVLYTYDAILLDYDLREGKDMLIKIRNLMSRNGKFPVKISAGQNYHSMMDMTSKLC